MQDTNPYKSPLAQQTDMDESGLEAIELGAKLAANQAFWNGAKWSMLVAFPVAVRSFYEYRRDRFVIEGLSDVFAVVVGVATALVVVTWPWAWFASLAARNRFLEAHRREAPAELSG